MKDVHLVVLQCHEVVMDVLTASVLLHPGFKLSVIQNLTAILQHKRVPEK